MCYWRGKAAAYRKRPVLMWLFAMVLLSACEQSRQPATFYPIDSLISAQIHHLAEIRAGLFKEALLGGERDTITYVPQDTIAWLDELGIFRELDIINKPVNRDNYQVENGLDDPASNLTIKAFSTQKELPVVYLKVFYQGTLAKPRKIEALLDEANALYSSSRLLSLHFEQVGDKTVLTRYSIEGGQQMIFGDSTSYYISGKILVD